MTSGAALRCPENEVDLRRREAESALRREREAHHRDKLAKAFGTRPVASSPTPQPAPRNPSQEKAEAKIEALSADLVSALEQLKNTSAELAASERKKELFFLFLLLILQLEAP